MSDYVYDAIVIGGGISGLTAGHILQKEGQRVLVLEARDRIGGRIHSVSLKAVESQDWPAESVDLGASYLHGCTRHPGQQPLFYLAAQLGVRTVVCPSDSAGWRYRAWEDPEISNWRDHRSGEAISVEEVGEVSQIFYKMLRRAFAIIDADVNLRSRSLKEVLDRALQDVLVWHHRRGERAAAVLSERECGILDSFICRFFYFVNPGERLTASKLLDLGYTREDVAGEDHFDPAFPCEEVREEHRQRIKSKLEGAGRAEVGCVNRTESAVEDRLVVSGFGRFVEALGERLDIRLGSVVSKVEMLGCGVRVMDRSGCVFSGRRCIVALPVGVLKGLDDRSQVSFEPPLPEEKIASIGRLGIPRRGAATHNKIVLRFPVVFWDTRSPHLKCPDARIHLLNLDFYGKRGILLAHIWGGSGFDLQEKTDEEAIELVMNALRGMYLSGGVEVEPVETVVTRWSEDPFTLGSYTDDERGVRAGDRATYASPLPSRVNPMVQFVGEATREDESKECTHGAFLSGFEAAKLALRADGVDFKVPKDKVVEYMYDRFHPAGRPRKRRRRQ